MPRDCRSRERGVGAAHGRDGPDAWRHRASTLQSRCAERRKATQVVDIPDGAQFLSRSFACAAGSRNYKLYIPRRLPESGRALLVMLHGGTQDGDDFAAGTRMNESRRGAWIYRRLSEPVQSRKRITVLELVRARAPKTRCRRACHHCRDHARNHRALHCDPGRVFIAGLSAGGAMAAVMAATYPDLYAAIGVHSGLPYRSATDLPSAFAAMRGDAGPRGRRARKPRGAAIASPRVRTIVFHGDADNVVHPSNAAGIVGASKLGESIERAETRSSDGRTYTRTRHPRPKRGGGRGGLAHSWERPCLVRRQRGWLLHRSKRPRCLTRNAALLLREKPRSPSLIERQAQGRAVRALPSKASIASAFSRVSPISSRPSIRQRLRKGSMSKLIMPPSGPLIS